MAFIDNIPSSASIDSSSYEDKSASNVKNTTVSNRIREEEKEEKTSKLRNLDIWLDKRSVLRKAISNWEEWTWNVWLDISEVRKSRVADLAREALKNAWKDADKIRKISDDDIIKRLVGSNDWTDNKKLNAFNQYIRNWWYAENVFNYLAGNTSSVYETIWEPEEEKSGLRNFAWAAISTPAESLAGLSDIVQKNVKYWWQSIYDINKQSDIAWLWNLVGGISEEEYQKYKSWELKSKRYQPYWEAEMPQNIGSISRDIEWVGQYASRMDLYKSYDKAKEMWFDGNVEQYWQYLYNMANDTYNSTAEQVRNYLETEVYDPEWKWAWLGKFAWEMLEFALLPASKVKYLKYAPEATKAAKAWVKAINAVKWIAKLWAEWVKLQALEDAYDAEVSSIWKYATTAAWNAAIWGILNWIWSVLWAPSWAAKTALWTKTTAEIEDMANIVKSSVKDYNAEITPRTAIRDLLTDAKEKLLWDRLTKWMELGEIRNFELKFKDWARYTAKDAIEKDINEALMQQASKKRFGNLAWKKELIPQFKFTKNWLEVSNADVLNNISRNEKDKVVKLWDEIKRVYSETYWAWARQNAATTEKFLRWLDRVFGKEWRSGWPENFINLMKEWIENATKKFDASLSEKSLSDLVNARAADEKAIKLYNAFNKILWNLEWVEWVWGAEKALWQTATTQELFKAVKEATKWKIDLNNEIGSRIAVLSAYDAKAAKKLVENIYPSAPWAMEFVIKSVLWALKKKWVMRAGSDYMPSARWKIKENIWWVVSSQL